MSTKFYCRTFDTESEYEEFKESDSFIRPNVSAVRETPSVHYSGLNKVSGASIGDIILYNNETGILISCSTNEYTSTYSSNSGYTPIGVCAISKDLTPEGYGIRIVSLKNMDYENPDSGSVATGSSTGTGYGYAMYWGGYGQTTGESYHTEVTLIDYTTGEDTGSTSSYGCVPIYGTDESIYTEGYLDGWSWWTAHASLYAAAPPVTSDGGQNSLYYDDNTLGDFDGAGHTATLVELATATQGEDWKTSETLTNSYSTGYFPAACSCWRYTTPGLSQGSWYLPAAGELAFLHLYRPAINTALSAIAGVSSDSAIVIGDTTNYSSYGLRLWSSSEVSSSYARYLHCYGNVVTSDGSKSYLYGLCRVRAFATIS